VRMVSRRQLQDRFQVEIAKKFASMLVVMGIVGLWYWFVAGQQIPFLSARFWLPLIVVAILVWILAIVRYVRKDVPAARAQVHSTKDDKKYFEPKHKK